MNIEDLSEQEGSAIPLEPVPESDIPEPEKLLVPDPDEDDGYTRLLIEMGAMEKPVKDDAPAEEASVEEPTEPNTADTLNVDQQSELEQPPEEDVPEEEVLQEGSPFRVPTVGAEITPDEDAMRYHGMVAHGEDPPFDLGILDDSKYTVPAEETQDDEEINEEYRDNGIVTNTANSASDEPAPMRRPVRKTRPKRRKGQGLLGIPQILVTAVWLAMILAIGVTMGRMLWICAADVLAFGREDKVVTITIYESDSMDQIVDKLYYNGLIRYKGLFNLYAQISDAEEDIKPGIYDLNTRYDYHALVNFMSPRSSRDIIQLTIPEGYSCRQIFSLLEEKRVCTAIDIGSYAANGELEDYWFLEGVNRGDIYCLEGYLFPDTYQFYRNSTPKEALERMLDNFDVRFSEEMRGQIDLLNEQLGAQYTVREITTVASLIEKESAAPAESGKIAGVIYNRLFRWDGTPAYLNIDAAIIYALEGKTDLTHEDLQVDSPYNTYKYTGLTPTPISNPGLSSLQAALNPEKHDYYYYVLNPATGMHQFSKTYEEHTGYVNKFAEG